MHMLALVTLAASSLAFAAAVDQQPPPRDPNPRPASQPRSATPAPVTPAELDEHIASLERAAASNPADPKGYLAIARRCEEWVRRQPTAPEADRWRFVLLGVQATDRALAVDGTFIEALVYKGILMRHQASLEPDPAQRKRLVDQADALRAKALALRQADTLARAAPAGEPRAECPARGPVDGLMPLRVGGSIKAPVKVNDVRPVYPAEAQQNRIQGVIIIETVVNAAGEVVEPCVLRTIPELEAAALDAVTQWRFEPVIFDGQPWPVVMTVTINFTLQQER